MKKAKKVAGLESFISDELLPLGQGEMMQMEADKVDMGTLVAGFLALNATAKAVKDRLDVLKETMHLVAEREGVTTPQGGQFLATELGGVLRELRVDKAPNEEKLRALLGTRDIELKECFDEVKTLTLNPSKLRLLIETGKLGKAEIEPLCDQGYAIVGKPSADTKGRLAEVFAAPEKKTRTRK